jgi:hypothetical protein
MFERKIKNFKKAQKIRGRPDEGTPSPLIHILSKTDRSP